MLDRRRVLDRQIAPDRALDADGFEAVGVRTELDAGRSIVKVGGVAELEGWYTLAGVVTLIGDLKRQIDAAALGFLLVSLDDPLYVTEVEVIVVDAKETVVEVLNLEIIRQSGHGRARQQHRQQ